MGNPTHQNVNGPCEHRLHPQSLLVEHQPRCHPPGDLLATGVPGVTAPCQAQGVWHPPRGALQCSASHLQATELERAKGEFQQIPGTAGPWGRIWPGCIHLVGKYWAGIAAISISFASPCTGEPPTRLPLQSQSWCGMGTGATTSPRGWISSS